MPRIICFAVCLGLLQAPSFAQTAGYDELYGEGVHRYFSNDLNGADQLLTQVVDSGSQDPRVYYFRGLAREQLGYGGEPDFEQGARLEAEGKRVVDVGNALSRIQGSVRTQIEVARRDARIAVRQQQLMLQRSRQPSDAAAARRAPAAVPASPLPSDSIPANETGLAPLVPPVAAAPTTPPATATAPSDTSDPFADDAAPAMDDADPFGAPATPAAPAADPFGAPATPATPPADAAADPFGAPATPAAPAADAAADPFGAPATPAAPAAGADPFSM